MYELLKAKLLILPDWVVVALEAHSLKPSDIETVAGLESILSADDVRFYLKQVNEIVNSISEKNGATSPLQALLDSTQVLHTNSFAAVGGGSMLQEFVKINTLYGTEFARYDFFHGLNMLSYLPRNMAAGLPPTVLVDPYVELADTDLFVLKFTTGFYQETMDLKRTYPERPKQFVQSTTRLLMANYGFDKVAGTKLFDLYSVIP